MDTRSQLDNQTVSTIRKLMNTKHGMKTLDIVRARYDRAMSKMGYDMMTAYRGFGDCCDIAELEEMAE